MLTMVGAGAVQNGDCKDLVGKAAFHFGAHAKGGSCDIMIPVSAIKFHSKLLVLPDGRVTIDYCTRRVRAARSLSPPCMRFGRHAYRPEHDALHWPGTGRAAKHLHACNTASWHAEEYAMACFPQSQ